MSKKEILKEEVITEEAVVEEAAEVVEEPIAEVEEAAVAAVEDVPEETTEVPEVPEEIKEEEAAKEDNIQEDAVEETPEAATCDERAYADVSEDAVDSEIRFVENVIMYNAPDLNRAGFPYTGNVQVVGPQDDEFIAVNYVRSGFGVVRGFLHK